MAYTRVAVERAMKVQEAILRALSGRQSWLQVADVLDVSPRTVRRLRWRYERYGYDGLFDHRRRRPSPEPFPWPRSSACCACTGNGMGRATAIRVQYPALLSGGLPGPSGAPVV